MSDEPYPYWSVIPPPGRMPTDAEVMRYFHIRTDQESLPAFSESWAHNPGGEVTMSFITDVRDLGERVGWTFAEAFLAVFVLTDTSTIRTAAVAAAAAAIVPVKEFVKAHKR